MTSARQSVSAVDSSRANRLPRSPTAGWVWVGRVISLIFAVIVLSFVWPPNWGGPVTFAIVSGTSMEPEYHTGDVVLAVRSPTGYAVGDVVVYEVHAGDVKGRIVHKIVGQKPDGTFIMQGTNKQFPDPWDVPSDWITGKVVLLIPQGYRVLLILRSPVFLAVMCGLLVTAALWPRNRDPDAEADSNEGTLP